MDEFLTRLRYFEGEELDAGDFLAGQESFIRQSRLHNQWLHTFGIARGLGIRTGPSAGTIETLPGVAYDAEGREIVLAENEILTLLAPGQSRYVSICYHEEPAEYVTNQQGVSGYKRIKQTPRFEISSAPPGNEAVILARVSFDGNNEILSIDLSVRRNAGISVGQIHFISQGIPSAQEPVVRGFEDDASPAPSIFGIEVESPIVQLLGSFEIEGRLGVGGINSEAALQVFNNWIPGVGLVSAAGRRVSGTGTRFTLQLTAGDFLRVSVGPRLEVARVIDDELLEITSDQQFNGAPFECLRAVTARFGNADHSLALGVYADGRVTVGKAQPQNRLQIGGGNMLLDKDYAVRFSDRGEIRTEKGDVSVDLNKRDAILRFRAASEIRISSGVQGVTPAKVMTLQADGNTAIGEVVAEQRLTVRGIIQSMQGGFRFPDGTVQTTSATFYPVGSILNWWCPANGDPILCQDYYAKEVPAGFEICRGQIVADPDSPLYGKKLPDFAPGLFVLGTNAFSEIGQTGGADLHTHEYTPPEHRHDFSHYHTTNFDVKPSGNEKELFPQTTKNDYVGANHTHSAKGTTTGYQPVGERQTGLSDYLGKTTVGDASQVPPFITVLKIIRIK